jgi:hypothetical protein
VVAVKFVPRPLAKSAIPFMMAEVEIQVRCKMVLRRFNVMTQHGIGSAVCSDLYHSMLQRLKYRWAAR